MDELLTEIGRLHVELENQRRATGEARELVLYLASQADMNPLIIHDEERVEGVKVERVENGIQFEIERKTE